VLPVEAGNEQRWGDGLGEIQKHRLHQQYPAFFVAPTFSHLPWYADHPSRAEIRQETYFLKVVLPFIEQRYPVQTEPSGRHLLGFSKSGYGAFSLLLRHPDVFGCAVAWDAPLAMAQPNRYGMGDIYGTQENFEHYRISALLEQRAAELRGPPRLFLLGYGNFRDQHQSAHALMLKLGVKHHYEDGPERRHHWDSGWVAPAVELLLKTADK
jgi:S-formylglutathione hydrolase FrmB